MKILFLSLVLVLAGCSATSTQPKTQAKLVASDTMEIIRSAAAAAPNAVSDNYILEIKAFGTQRASLFLNTERDYRDQRNVTVSLNPDVASKLYKRYGQHPGEYFVGKTIAVKGEAKRVKIYFFSNGRQSEKYYYQTHIAVEDASQIEVVSEHA